MCGWKRYALDAGGYAPCTRQFECPTCQAKLNKCNGVGLMDACYNRNKKCANPNCSSTHIASELCSNCTICSRCKAYKFKGDYCYNNCEVCGQHKTATGCPLAQEPCPQKGCRQFLTHIKG